MDVWGFAFWGLCGAFVYAAPRLLVSLTELISGAPARLWLVLAEFAVSLSFGPIGAAGFSQFVANTLHQTTVPELRAIAVVIGMIANPTAPLLVHLFQEQILHRFSAPLKKLSPSKPRSHP